MLAAKLIEAALEDDADALRRLLDDGADPDARDDEGRTALYAAADAGRAEAVRLLLASGASPDRGPEHWTPLAIALENQVRLEVIEALVDGGADPDQQSWESGYTALMGAATMGGVALTRALLSKGVRLDTRTRDGEGPAIVFAAQGGHVDVVDALLEAPVLLLEDDRDEEDGADSLRIPCKAAPLSATPHRDGGPQPKTYKSLLGAETLRDLDRAMLFPGARDHARLERVLPRCEHLLRDAAIAPGVWRAALESDAHAFETIEARLRRLTEPIATFDQMDLDSALRALAHGPASRAPAGDEARRWTAVVETIVSRMPTVPVSSLHSLVRARTPGAEALVDPLMAKGASLSARYDRDATPLLAACAAGSLPMVEALLARGASVRERDSEGHGPVAYARTAADPSAVVERLLAAGARREPARPEHGTGAVTLGDKLSLAGCLVLLVVIVAAGLLVLLPDSCFGV